MAANMTTIDKLADALRQLIPYAEHDGAPNAFLDGADTALAEYDANPGGWRAMDSAPQRLKLLVGYHNSCGHWRNVTAIYYPDDALPTEEVTDDGEDEFAPAGWYEASETHDCIQLTELPPAHWQPLPPPPKEPQS